MGGLVWCPLRFSHSLKAFAGKHYDPKGREVDPLTGELVGGGGGGEWASAAGPAAPAPGGRAPAPVVNAEGKRVMTAQALKAAETLRAGQPSPGPSLGGNPPGGRRGSNAGGRGEGPGSRAAALAAAQAELGLDL